MKNLYWRICRGKLARAALCSPILNRPYLINYYQRNHFFTTSCWFWKHVDSFNSVSMQGGRKVKNSFLIYYSQPMFSVIFHNVSKCWNVLRNLCVTTIIVWMAITFLLKCKKSLFNYLIICAKLLILTVRFLFNSGKALSFWWKWRLKVS